MSKVRITIAVESETLEAFREHAAALGISLSKACGGWLDESVDAVRMVSNTVREARSGPARALRNLSELMASAEVQTGQMRREVVALLGPEDSAGTPTPAEAGRSAGAQLPAAGRRRRGVA